MKDALKIKYDLKRLLVWGLGFALMVMTEEVIAGAKSLGNMASSVTGSFTNVAMLVTAGSYLAGLAFSIAAIMKFKQHKDNPTQIPIGTPISLTFIAAALLFLPSILGVAGSTMFGSAGGSVAGATGKLIGTDGS